MADRAEVIIVGGGVIGLASAYALACLGVRPIVLERGRPGREASWAGAGLVAPLAERPGPHALVQLRAWSSQIYPEWSQRLRDETGVDIGYRRSGGVDVAVDEADEQALVQAAGAWRSQGVAFERLAPADIPRVEPALARSIRAAFFLPDRAQVRNPWLLRALAQAVARRGGVIHAGAAVLEFVNQGDRICAVQTPIGRFDCHKLVLAAGAWSGLLLSRVNLTLKTPPRKGQIVLLRAAKPLLKRIVEHGKRYLVPRDDGRILIGATEEDAGFDCRPTREGYEGLLAWALELCPRLREADVEATWTGPRPGSIDSRPYLGYAPRTANLIVATGHHRAGLQLAPATAELVVDLVLERKPRIEVAPFRLDRSPEWDEDSAAYRS